MRRTTGQSHTRHRRNAGECLAAKTQRRDPFQIIQCLNFAGGVSAYGQWQIVMTDTYAVISDPNQAYTTLFKYNVNSICPCIKRVFEQFLDHGSRPLNHLSSCDLVNQLLIQLLYKRHNFQLAGIFSTWPMRIRSPDRPLASLSLEAEMRCRSAIPDSVSPLTIR